MNLNPKPRTPRPDTPRVSVGRWKIHGVFPTHFRVSLGETGKPFDVAKKGLAAPLVQHIEGLAKGDDHGLVDGHARLVRVVGVPIGEEATVSIIPVCKLGNTSAKDNGTGVTWNAFKVSAA